LEDLTKRPAIAGIKKLEPMGEMASGVSEGMEDENVWSTRAVSGEGKGAGFEGVSGFSWQPLRHDVS